MKLDEPKEAGEKVRGASRIIRNRTMGVGVNVASDFVLPDNPMSIPVDVQAGLMGLADGDVIAIVEEVYEYEAMLRPISGGLGWYPKDHPEEVRTVQQAKVCWPRNKSQPSWIWQVRDQEAAQPTA